MCLTLPPRFPSSGRRRWPSIEARVNRGENACVTYRQIRGQPPSSPAAQTTRYFTSVSILNIGMYIEMMTMPTMMPTPIIMTGSMIDVSEPTAASTSSS